MEKIIADIHHILKDSNNAVCVNLFYAKFRNLTCTAYLEMF